MNLPDELRDVARSLQLTSRQARLANYVAINMAGLLITAQTRELTESEQDELEVLNAAAHQVVGAAEVTLARALEDRLTRFFGNLVERFLMIPASE